MKALILWAESESKNLGVRALAEGTANLLDRAFPGIKLFYQGFGPGDAPVRIGSPKAQLIRVLSPRNELVSWVRNFDLVVDTRAGDSFADIYGMRRMMTMSLMAEIVHRSKVPMVLGPQTIGPFQTRRGRFLAARSMKQAKVVMARDSQSAEQAAAAGRPVDLLTTDVVFAIPQVDAQVTRDVVLNASGLLWHQNPHVEFESYRRTIRELCDKLLAAGRRVSLLAHVLDSPLMDNDVLVTSALAEEYGDRIEVLIPRDLLEVREMIASGTVIIGSRMHACLNALSLGRPAVSLAYSRKFEPLLNDLGWPHTVDLRAGDDHADRVLAVLSLSSLASDARSLRMRADERLLEAESLLRTAV